MKKLILLSIMICLPAWSMDDSEKECFLVFPAATYMFYKLEDETQRYIARTLNILPAIEIKVLSKKEVIEQIDKAAKIYARQNKVYLRSTDIAETTNAIIKTGTIIHTPPPKL